MPKPKPLNSNKKLFKGLFWSISEVLLKRLFDLVVKLILTKLLYPEDFGIVSMAVVFTSFALVLSEMGIGAALVQRKDEEITDKHFQTVFTTSVVWSIVLYIALILIGTPLIVSFYNIPILAEITPILGIPILFSGITLIHKAKLMRLLDFKRIAIINSIGSLVSGFGALLLAYQDFGIWALIFNVISPLIIVFPLLFIATSWIPKLGWDFTSFKEIFSFGFFTFVTAIITNLSGNIDFIFIGKYINAETLGCYSLAFMLTILVSSQMKAMVNRVMFPFYSKIQTNTVKMKNYYFTIIEYYAILIYPVMLAFLLLGKQIIVSFFDPRWIDASQPLQILAVVVIIDVFTGSSNILFRSIGKPKIEMMILLLITVLVLFPSVFFGGMYYGIKGVAYGLLITAVINMIAYLFFLKKYFKIELLEVLNKLKHPLIAFVITLGFNLLLLKFTSITFYYLIGIIFLTYGLLIFSFYRKEIKVLLVKIIKQKHSV